MTLDLAASRRHPRGRGGQFARRVADPRSERLTFRLTSAERDDLEDLAGERDRSTSDVVRDAVRAYVKAADRRAVGLR